MSEEKKHALYEVEGLIPDLRFPGFLKDKTWVRDTLGALTNVISNRNKENKNLPVYSINNKEGFLPQGDQFEGISSTERNYDISLYKVIDRNTFAYNPARINVGSIGYSGDLENIIISSLYVCFKTKEKVNDEFLLQFIKTPFFNKEVENNVEGGIRNYLFYQNFSNISIPIPSIQEQQKIASCLFSLDELIAAHNDKLDALKDQKKGLMQDLFPHPSAGSGSGRNLPTYRFPEFEQDVEWVEKKLGEVSKFLSGGTPSKSNPLYWGGRIPWISASSMHDIQIHDSELKITEQAIKAGTRIVKEGTILILVRGSMLFNRVPICITMKAVSFNQDVKALILNENCATRFLLYQLLAYESFIPIDKTGIGAGKIGLEELKELTLYIPKSGEEQKKIASCLSALDELIMAQADRIEQLQLHKKGLMQGLFPKIKG